MSNLSLLQEKDLKYVFHPCTQMKEYEETGFPVIVKADGIYLYDEHGNKYLDAISSWWVNLFGHANKRINNVISSQINELEHLIFANFTHRPAIDLCDELTKVLPLGLEKFLFADNGSSSVEMALKLSYQYHLQTGNPQKTKFISFENAYHGETIGALGVGDVDIFTKTYKPLITEAMKIKVPYRNFSMTDEEFSEVEEACIENMKKIIAEHHYELASVIVEPIVQGAAGMLMYSPKFLKALREETRKYNIHLIDDEIAMGFGRTGKMFACEHAEIVPDIMCLSKGISTGYYPMAVVCITQQIFDAFYADYKEGKSFLHSHTYSGNPIGCRIAVEVLKIFKEENILKQVNKKAEYLAKKVFDTFKNEAYIYDIRNIGMIAAIEVKNEKNIRLSKEVFNKAAQKGLLLRPIGNTVYFLPPYIITEEEIDFMVETTKEVIEEIL